MLMSRPSAVRARLGNDPLISVRYTEASGDCFYEAVQQALKELGYFFISVELLREVVAESLSLETFQMYRLLHHQSAEGFGFMRGVNSLDQLRAKVRLLGRKVGGRNAVWADGFAMETIASHFRICLLIVDERMPSSQRFTRIMPKPVEPTSPTADAANAAAAANVAATMELEAEAAAAKAAAEARNLAASADAVSAHTPRGVRAYVPRGAGRGGTRGRGGKSKGGSALALAGAGGNAAASDGATAPPESAADSPPPSTGVWLPEYASLVAVMLHASCREHMNLVLYNGRVCHALASLPPALLGLWGIAPDAAAPPPTPVPALPALPGATPAPPAGGARAGGPSGEGGPSNLGAGGGVPDSKRQRTDAAASGVATQSSSASRAAAPLPVDGTAAGGSVASASATVGADEDMSAVPAPPPVASGRGRGRGRGDAGHRSRGRGRGPSGDVATVAARPPAAATKADARSGPKALPPHRMRTRGISAIEARGGVVPETSPPTSPAPSAEVLA